MRDRGRGLSRRCSLLKLPFPLIILAAGALGLPAHGRGRATGRASPRPRPGPDAADGRDLGRDLAAAPGRAGRLLDAGLLAEIGALLLQAGRR